MMPQQPNFGLRVRTERFKDTITLGRPRAMGKFHSLRSPVDHSALVVVVWRVSPTSSTRPNTGDPFALH
jgi:hypothetical protein